MRSILKVDKRGQAVSVGTVTALIVGIMVMIFVVFAVLYGITTLNPASFFATGSLDANATQGLQSNLTTGIGNFGSKIPTVFTIIAVVFILGFIGLLVATVYRFASGAGTGRL
jgi:hypothetical protein